MAALCEVQEMNSPLVLSILAPNTKTLTMSYSLPNVWYLLSTVAPHPTDTSLHFITVYEVAQTDALLLKKSLLFAFSSATVGEEASALILDFGDDVVLKRAVTKQFLMTNQTGIPAPFTIEAEYFNCHAYKPNNHSEKK